MINFFQSSITGNIVGIISLMVGVISFILTVKTYNRTKLVEKQINNIKNKTAATVLLDTYRTTAIKILEDKFTALTETGIATAEFIRSLLVITQTLIDYSKALEPKDAQLIQDAHNYMFNFTEYHDERQIRRLEAYIVNIANILKKGNGTL